MSKKIIGVTVGTPISYATIKDNIEPNIKSYVDSECVKIRGICQDFSEGRRMVKSAENAVNAVNAEYADFADAADYATEARTDYNGNVIHETYATKNEVAEQLGNVDAMLDYILAKQNSLIGGDA